MKTVRVMIEGVVQGVYYRKWTVGAARDLGLKGWVRNRQNGSVEAVFSGQTAQVDEMLAQCLEGPLKAVVSAVDVFDEVHADLPQKFEKRKTA
ncbi:MAG: acylphosphatase [Alphaproteobacteria bacterium]